MRVAFISPEAVPFAGTGGLGEVAGSLPKALAGEGVDVALVLPLHRAHTKREDIKERVFDNLEVEWFGRRRHVSVWLGGDAKTPAFLIDEPEYFARKNVYGYSDDISRFAFFSRAALSLLGRLGRAPDVLHFNDWTCGFASAWLRAGRPYGGFFAGTRSLFTIHNLGVKYQARFDPADLWRLGFRDGEEQNAFMHNGLANPMKAGLMTCDAISTVSPRYSREILSMEQGAELDWLLRMRHDRLIGITNGVDYEVWNPSTDKELAANYSAEDLSGKRECKLALLREFGLPEEPDRPLVAVVTRLASEKIELLRQLGEASSLLSTGAFFIALGGGSDEYESFLNRLRAAAPHRVGVYLGRAVELSHRIYAGADIFPMPSLYEPCGLGQMYAMRYGTVPVVRATGGLDDTVEQFDPETGGGTGFKFEPYEPQALLDKLREALHWYKRPEVWRRIQLNGMNVDNSWQAAARKYVRVYGALPKLD